MGVVALLAVHGLGVVVHGRVVVVRRGLAGQQLHAALGQRPGWSLTTSGCIG